MDHRSEIRAFLSSRRANITPQQAGLPAWGGTRRVPGLRPFFGDWTTAARDMVAALRIEAGRNPHDRGLSDLVGELSTRGERRRRHDGHRGVTLPHVVG